MLLLHKTKKRKKVLLITGIATGVLAIAAGTYVFIVHPFGGSNKTSDSINSTTSGNSGSGEMRNVNDVSYSAATDTEKQDSEKAKQTSQQNAQSGTSGAAPTATITRAGQTGSTVSIRTFIDNAANGECTITLTQNAATVVKTTQIVGDVNSSRVCNIDVPTSEFGASGAWDMNIIAKSGSQTSQAATQTININL